MNKYLITENTVALIKKNNKTIIYNVDNVQVVNTRINKILEYNCNYYGSSLEGRKISAKNILNIHYKIPIFINNDMILLQINSPRNNDAMYIMNNKIIDYRKVNNSLEITCLNNHKFITKITENTLEKLIINSLRLNNILNWRKNVKFS